MRKQTHIQTVSYRYCYNSDGIDVQGSQQIFPGNREHIPSLDGFHSGDKLTLAYQGEISELDGRGRVLPTLRICERLFQIFNAPWDRPDEYAGPSMSVGDVVTFFPGTKAEISFSPASVGFVPADISQSQIEARPYRWIRNEQLLSEYLRTKAEGTS